MSFRVERSLTFFRQNFLLILKSKIVANLFFRFFEPFQRADLKCYLDSLYRTLCVRENFIQLVDKHEKRYGFETPEELVKFKQRAQSQYKDMLKMLQNEQEYLISRGISLSLSKALAIIVLGE